MTTGNQNKTLLLAGWIALILLAVTSKVSHAIVTGSYMYNLSNFYGVVGYEWCHPYFDLKTGEIYVAQGGSVQIFNTAGMEIYSFSDGELGVIQDVSTDSEGNILALSWKNLGFSIVKCNFRGEPREEIRIANLPKEFAGFSPNRMVFREGLFYLVDKSRLRVAVVDRDGTYLKGYDLASLIAVKDDQRADNDIFGFNMDREGNMLFTVPAQFLAYKVTPEGKVFSFGRRGSGPGRFGVAAGITADGKGNILVSDSLRGVVMIFDKEFRFQSEFGFRGLRPGNLIVPRDLETDGDNRVFVTQMRKRGISVFQLSEN
jgi:hypothetical protein